MAHAIPTLEKTQLILKPLEMADAEAIQAAFPQWQIVRYLLNKVPWPYPPDGAETFLRDIALPQMAAGTDYHWSIRRTREPDWLIGVISLHDHSDEHRGFWIEPSWQGRGIASEACAAVTDYWFTVLNKPVLRVSEAVSNVASRRISERTGMRMIGTVERDYVAGRLPAERWEITWEEWEANASTLGR